MAEMFDNNGRMTRSGKVKLGLFIAALLGFLGIVMPKLLAPAPPAERLAAEQAETERGNAWSVPGFRHEYPMRAWRDPDTGCEYLILPNGYGMTQRVQDEKSFRCDPTKIVR